MREINNDAVGQTIQDIEAVLSKANLTVGELLLVYGNLGYRLGANLRRACYDDKFVSEPPNLEKLNKLYYINPTEDIALMLTGLTVTAWVQSLENKEK
jgi:hypothetical protein